MQNQSFKQVFENNIMDVALHTLRNSIARWTDQMDRFTGAIPGLLLHRLDEPSQPPVSCASRVFALSRKASNGLSRKAARIGHQNI
jgi:hypothetical protein